MATKHLLATLLLLGIARSATGQNATAVSLGVPEYIGIAFGVGGLICIVATVVGLCCGLCCCCSIMKRKKKERGTMLYATDGRPITYVKNAHSQNLPLGSREYDGIKMYPNTQTFKTFVPSYKENDTPDQKVGFSRTTYVARPSQVSQVIQEGPTETGHISPSTSFSDTKPLYTATVGPNRTSVGSFSNPTFSRSSITRSTSIVSDTPAAMDNVVSQTETVTTTETKETHEESSEFTTKTETRRSIIKS